jgi:hypothetical protein
MKDITSDTELAQKITNVANEVPGPQLICDTSYVYVSNHNGMMISWVTVKENGICDVSKVTQVSYKKSKSSEKNLSYESLYPVEKSMDNLNRLYKSAGGYIGVYNYIHSNYEVTVYIYMDNNFNKVSEVWSGKTMTDNRWTYKREIVYDVEN